MLMDTGLKLKTKHDIPLFFEVISLTFAALLGIIRCTFSCVKLDKYILDHIATIKFRYVYSM